MYCLSVLILFIVKLNLNVILGILDGTSAAFDALGTVDWKTKCVAFGADGAAVNMGVHRGVIALLKRDMGNHVIPIHCMPHRSLSSISLII